jgi:hypothetical protein
MSSARTEPCDMYSPGGGGEQPSILEMRRRPASEGGIPEVLGSPSSASSSLPSSISAQSENDELKRQLQQQQYLIDQLLQQQQYQQTPYPMQQGYSSGQVFPYPFAAPPQPWMLPQYNTLPNFPGTAMMYPGMNPPPPPPLQHPMSVQMPPGFGDNSPVATSRGSGSQKSSVHGDDDNEWWEDESYSTGLRPPNGNELKRLECKQFPRIPGVSPRDLGTWLKEVHILVKSISPAMVRCWLYSEKLAMESYASYLRATALEKSNMKDPSGYLCAERRCHRPRRFGACPQVY